jgi:hypothetical protein
MRLRGAACLRWDVEGAELGPFESSSTFTTLKCTLHGTFNSEDVPENLQSVLTRKQPCAKSIIGVPWEDVLAQPDPTFLMR